MLTVWNTNNRRATMDIDFLGQIKNDEKTIVSSIKNIIETEIEPDGIIFKPNSIEAEKIKENAEYEGQRIWFLGALGKARINMQIDIGFGDIVYPAPETCTMPTILNSPPPKLLCYSRESVIAEKFEAIINLGFLNSRMKDFFDIWLLSRQFNFEGLILSEAVRITFEKRGTKFPSEIDAFSKSFIEEKQAQWKSFCNRTNQSSISDSFSKIIADLEIFLTPLATISKLNNKNWQPNNHWEKYKD